MTLPTRTASVYLAPLREGGSLPAVVGDQDGELWVVKFRGAGQGPKALVAEILVAGIAEVLGLRAPGLSLVTLDETFGQGERDPEIRDVLKASTGVNVGMRYLDGAFNLDPVAVGDDVDPDFAARTVWLDALVVNPDRMARNPNMMFYRGEPWLIDHGAALFDHHDWSRVDEARMRRSFPAIKDHVLLSRANPIDALDEELAARLTPAVIGAIVEQVPDALLTEPAFGSQEAESPDRLRERYRLWFNTRLEGPRSWADEAERARLSQRPPEQLEARR